MDREPKKIIVGLGHQSNTGKDSIAIVLIQKYGFRKIAFADALKEAACCIFGWDRMQLESQAFKAEEDKYWGMTPRKILQLMGTEAMRNCIDPDIWVKAWIRRVNMSPADARIVCTDVRFPNEADAIHRVGGNVVKVIRSGIQRMDHPSETALADYVGWDSLIYNEGTLSDLEQHTDKLMDYLTGPRHYT